MNTRTVAVAIVTTVVLTLYSLSELHGLSVEHSLEDAQDLPTGSSRLDTPKGAGSKIVLTPKTQVVKPEPIKQHFSALVDTSIASATIARLKKENPAGGSKKCYTYQNTELWGDVVVWGNSFKTDTAGDCCDACRYHRVRNGDDPECNVFVWCGDQAACKEQYKECWLKHLPYPEASKPARQGPNCPWTSGTIDVDINAKAGQGTNTQVDPNSRKFHTITSAQGAAVHWQARIHYYWFKKQKAACEAAGSCHMGGFTRLLHSGHPDDLVGEIPTMVVDPLPSDMVEHSWYVVLNRPYAFVQWVQKANIPERYVLMSEPDHIFLRPLPNFMVGDTPAAFPFFYIEPAKQNHIHITKKFVGDVSRKELEQIAPIGNSPTYMTFEDMKKTMPLWMNTSIAIFKDAEAQKEWGWVQEMYGFTIAAWKAGIRKFDLHLQMMAQPPWDTHMDMSPGKPFYILHFTYGMDYKLTGEFTPGKIGEWRFDKRSYGSMPIPRHLSEPPKGMQNDLVRFLINAFNEATDAIPCWDEYAKTGKIPQVCSEAPKHFLAEEAAKKAAGKQQT